MGELAVLRWTFGKLIVWLRHTHHTHVVLRDNSCAKALNVVTMTKENGMMECAIKICDINPYRMGNLDFYGRGSQYSVNTLKPMTLVTQFLTTDGTDSGICQKLDASMCK